MLVLSLLLRISDVDGWRFTAGADIKEMATASVMKMARPDNFITQLAAVSQLRKPGITLYFSVFCLLTLGGGGFNNHSDCGSKWLCIGWGLRVSHDVRYHHCRRQSGFWTAGNQDWHHTRGGRHSTTGARSGKVQSHGNSALALQS